MFDEWGYGIVAESTTQAKAARRKSIVQKIVQTHDLPPVDYAALRVRRNSLPKQHPRPRIPLEWPLSRKEKHEFWDPGNWITRQPRASLPDPTLGADLAASYLDTLKQQATVLAENLGQTQAQLDTLTSALDALSTKSTQARKRQHELDTLYEEVGQSLTVYDKLESATRSLNSPGTRIITSSTFPQLLKDLAQGLEFCQAHPDYKDMDLYELRHQQCISRANAMVLDHCTSVWRASQLAITPKLSGASQVTVEALLWPKFAADTAKLQPIISNSQGQVLLELRQAYSKVRSQLLASQVQRTLGHTFSQTLAQLKDVYMREKQLWVSTFDSDQGFRDFSLIFSEPMYIELRGQIVHETSIESLCNIIVLLQDEQELPVSQQILKDTQNRLLFRADQVVDQALQAKITPKVLRASRFVYVHEILGLLSQLYEVMTQSVFEQFAHQSIRNCMLALRNTNASELLGPIEGTLFHIKQIVSLQHGILEYDLGQITQPHIDFSGLGSLLETVRTTPQTLLSFEKFVDSMPQVVDQLSDSLQELHTELQVVVQQFTANCVDELLAPVAKNDPASAQEDTRVLKKLAPKTFERILTLANQHVADAKIVEALMDSIVDSFVESYKQYYSHVYHTGSPDQLQGVLDPDSFVSWLAHTREASRAATDHSEG